MTAPSEQLLERRLRRLLACYPASYRAANADEMLGVALARATDGQRWPSLAEAASLISSGIGKRLGSVALPRSLRDDAWRDAAIVLTIIGPIVLAAAAARGIPVGRHVSWQAAGETAGWSALAIVACLNWRRVTALGSAVGLADAIVQYVRWSPAASRHASGWWTVILALAITLAAVTTLRSAPSRVLSRRAIIVSAAGVGMPAVSGIVLGALATFRIGSDHVPFQWSAQGDITKLVDAIVTVLAGLLLAIVVSRLRGAVRRRVAVMLFPVLVTFALSADSLYRVFVVRLWWLEMAPTAAPVQLAAMAVVPIGCFAVGLIWLARYEQTLRRVAQEGIVT